TGYRAERVSSIGSVFANPAIQTNRLYTVVAENCEAAGPLQQDDGEDIQVRLVAPEAVPELIRAGTIHHGLVLSAWLLYELWRVQRSASRT
ncbi:MAG: NUDIX hydrolase, partial [Pseudomonas sp.]